MNLELLKTFIPDFSEIHEIELKNENGTIIGYQAHIVNSSGHTLGGGTSEDIETAIQIAIAESIERSIFAKALTIPDIREKFHLDKYPTTCGFAAGFTEKTARVRSICEAVERWAWEQWIDNGLYIPIIPNPKLPEMSQFFHHCFDKVIYHSVSLETKILGMEKLRLVIALGIKDKGIFPGSRVTGYDDIGTEHALTEAWRHYQIFTNELKGRATDHLNIIDKRICYFGNSWESALAQISKDPDGNGTWPIPDISIHEQVFASNKLWVFRTLCTGLIGWEKGPIERFIY